MYFNLKFHKKKVSELDYALLKLKKKVNDVEFIPLNAN